MPETSPAAAESSVLTLEYALKSPGYANSHSWSSDSRRVAIAILQGSTLYERSTIYTLEAGSQALAGPLADGRPTEHVALSQDGRLVAATAAREVRVYAADKFVLLARGEAPVPDCYFGGSAAFSPDSTSLWVPCSPRQNLGPGQS